MARPKTKSVYESRKEYAQKSYDRILLQMPKGARDQIAAKAAAAGISTSRYILEAVESRSGLKLTLDNALPWMNSENKK
jgi:hypothetical protein